MRGPSSLGPCVGCVLGVLAAARSAEPEEVPEPGPGPEAPAAPGEKAETRAIFNIPRLTVGGGTIRASDHADGSFLTPGGSRVRERFRSKYDEDAFAAGLGWDLIFGGRHALVFDFLFDSGLGIDSETWRESGVTVQQNDMQIRRYEFSLGYLASSWDRSLPPADLEGLARWFRIDGGLGVSYRLQESHRADFFDPREDPPAVVHHGVNEYFNMVGPEATMGIEVGPRHIVAGFVRGRVGGGYVRVKDHWWNRLGLAVEDSGADTAEVHGGVEAGVVSQFRRHLQLRLGFRYLRQEIFGRDEKFFSGFSPRVVVEELPDTSIELRLVFLEVGWAF